MSRSMFTVAFAIAALASVHRSLGADIRCACNVADIEFLGVEA